MRITIEAIMPCWQLQNTVEHRERVGDPQQSQVLVQRLKVYAARRVRQLQQSFYFRRESEARVLMAIIKRLDAEVIARNEKVFSLVIPNGKSEHAVQAT